MFKSIVMEIADKPLTNATLITPPNRRSFLNTVGRYVLVPPLIAYISGCGGGGANGTISPQIPGQNNAPPAQTPPTPILTGKEALVMIVNTRAEQNLNFIVNGGFILMPEDLMAGSTDFNQPFGTTLVTVDPTDSLVKLVITDALNNSVGPGVIELKPKEQASITATVDGVETELNPVFLADVQPVRTLAFLRSRISDAEIGGLLPDHYPGLAPEHFEPNNIGFKPAAGRSQPPNFIDEVIGVGFSTGQSGEISAFKTYGGRSYQLLSFTEGDEVALSGKDRTRVIFERGITGELDRRMAFAQLKTANIRDEVNTAVLPEDGEGYSYEYPVKETGNITLFELFELAGTGIITGHDAEFKLQLTDKQSTLVGSAKLTRGESIRIKLSTGKEIEISLRKIISFLKGSGEIAPRFPLLGLTARDGDMESVTVECYPKRISESMIGSQAYSLTLTAFGEEYSLTISVGGIEIIIGGRDAN